METIKKKELSGIFLQIKNVMDENKEYLIKLDSVMGDGDLGLTMSNGFSKVYEELENYEEDSVGKIFAKAGMVLAEASPSTLGTLISGGLIKGGLAIKDKTEADVSGLAVFFSEFVEKISLTGKAKFGDKTIVDALFPAAESLKDSAAKGLDFQESFKAAYEKAKTGFEETKNLLAKFGRAKRYGEQSIGIVDPGAAAGMLFVKAFYDYFNR